MASDEMLGTVEWLVAELGHGLLLERAHLLPLIDEFREMHPDGDAMRLAEFLVERGALTAYQIEKVMEGDASELVLGPYVLVEPVGASGMGVVYRAVDRADRQPFAVKVLPARGEWNVRLARKQVRALADMPPHPAVVQCVDVGGAAGRQYLAWPFVVGETLESILSRHGAFTPDDVRHLALHLAGGLHAAHEAGVVHGLVRASNVQIGENGEVRLLDFGVGALLVDEGQEPVPADDHFGLGQVLMFALSGRAMMSAAELGELPAELGEAIARLLGQSTAGRFRHLGEVVGALRVRRAEGEYVPAHETPRIGMLDDTPPVMSRPFQRATLTTAAPHLPDLNRGNPPVRRHASDLRPQLTPPTSHHAAHDMRQSSLRRALDKFTFWRTRRDPLAVSVLAPTLLPIGDQVTLAVFAHRTTQPISALARTYFPKHEPTSVATLPRPIARGARLTLHLALPGLTVEPPTQKFVWNGQPLPLPSTVVVSPDFRPGEVVGVLTVAEDGDVMMNLEFRVLIGK